MAAKNEVTLTFAADTEELSRAFSKLQGDAGKTGNSFDGLGRDAASGFDRARTSSRDLSGSFDRLSDGADRGEQRIIGMRDAITGSKDLMEGWRTGSMELVLTGFADLASSVANFAGPMLGTLASKLGITTLATRVMAGAQTLLNATMRANPFVLIATLLIAVGAALVVAYQKSETFRNIVNAAFGVVKSAANGVRDAVGWVLDKLLDLYNSPAGDARAGAPAPGRTPRASRTRGT